jgi:hypothetical protein
MIHTEALAKAMLKTKEGNAILRSIRQLDGRGVDKKARASPMTTPPIRNDLRMREGKVRAACSS